ncbi:Lysophospholipase L1 [Cohnella sp. OV330]|uniref:SGNH/GDSL hydrolase family protein n=1 Tax=Cohnella sp. OV330 TaxID=1855288 RepID=UPI0008EA179F|nr:SGNH/GDSL hydrolase family protein [Cohnella sp. OV330]SFB39201.1 Lysophospholipase L1 [Cohnella sp. OV330]
MKRPYGRQQNEAFVFVGEAAMPFRYPPDRAEPPTLRSQADASCPGAVAFEEGADYLVDYERGTIRRTKRSRIPDGALHPLHGAVRFDHTNIDCSNRAYTVYADYRIAGTDDGETWATAHARDNRPRRRLGNGKKGGDAVYVVFGDSISAGGDASDEKYMYFNRFLQYVNERAMGGGVRLINRSVGGETSEGGWKRIREDVAALRPALVSIAYGMNDQNLYDTGLEVEPDAYAKHLRDMIACLREIPDCEIVLVTPCSPHPAWKHASGRSGEYADAVRRLSAECEVGVADVYAAWQRELAAGKTPNCLLLNHINHPNDYGHQIYYETLVDWFERR